MFFILLSLLSFGSQALISDIEQVSTQGVRAGEGYYDVSGKHITFQSEQYPDNPFYQIYTKNLKTGKTELVSTGLGKTTCSWFHPDSSRVLFSSTHLDPKAMEKQQEEMALRKSGKKKQYAWSFDEHYDIFVRDLKTKKIERLTFDLGYDAEASFSPDGTKVLFASNKTAYKPNLTATQLKQKEKDPSYFMDIY